MALAAPALHPTDQPTAPLAIGIDVGGSSIKAAFVDVSTGHVLGWHLVPMRPDSRRCRRAAGRSGTVLVTTLGTGIGTALFHDGRLVPNFELGHMEIRGAPAESRSGAAARTRDNLGWDAWAADLDEHMRAIHRLMWPELIVLGGGVSEQSDARRTRGLGPQGLSARLPRSGCGHRESRSVPSVSRMLGCRVAVEWLPQRRYHWRSPMAVV